MPIKKKKEADTNEWLNRLKAAEKALKRADEKYGYTTAVQQYQGDYEKALPNFLRDIPLIPINEVHSFVKTFIPTVYSRNPKIIFNPKGYKSIAPSKIYELAVNGYWRDLRLKKVAKKAIFDAIFCEGYIKVGYFAEVGRNVDENAPDLEPNEFIKRQDIFAVRVPWQSMVRDPDAMEGLDDARFVAQRITKPLDAVKGSPLFNRADDARATHIYRPNEFDLKTLGNKRQASNSEIEYISFWEVWDKDTEKVYAISEGEDGHLWEPKDWPYEMEGFPYVMLRFNENQDEAYAPNLISPWVPQLWEKMKIRAMQLDHIKRFGRQMQCDENAMEQAEEQKFAMGITGSVIKMKNGKRIEPIPYPQIQTDMYAVEQRIDLDKDNVSGQPNAVRSAPQRTQSRTLGEIDRLISAFQARQSEPQDLVEEFCAEVGIKIAALMKQYFNLDKYVRASREDAETIIQAFGEEVYDGTGFKFTKKMIQDCEFDVEVKTGSTLPIDVQNRIEAMTTVLKLGPTIGIQPAGETAVVIGKNMLQGFEMKEVEMAYEKELARIRAEQAVQARAAEQQIEEGQVQVNQLRQRMEQGA